MTRNAALFALVAGLLTSCATGYPANPPRHIDAPPPAAGAAGAALPVAGAAGALAR